MESLSFTNHLAHQEGHHNEAAEVKLNDQYLKPFFGRVFLSLCELKEEKKESEKKSIIQMTGHLCMEMKRSHSKNRSQTFVKQNEQLLIQAEG